VADGKEALAGFMQTRKNHLCLDPFGERSFAQVCFAEDGPGGARHLLRAGALRAHWVKDEPLRGWKTRGNSNRRLLVSLFRYCEPAGKTSRLLTARKFGGPTD
jgi:hypothetical protein